MPSPSTLAAFAIAAIALIALPGPNLAYLVGRSVSDGRRAGVLSAVGIETGTLVHTCAAALGLSALLASSAAAYSVVKYAGAAYLIYLGVRALLAARRAGGEPAAAGPAPEPARGARVFRQALVVQMLNPKVALFFLAFLPQFIDPGKPAAAQILVLGSIMALLGTAFGIAAAFAAGSLAERMRARGRTGRAWGRWAGGCVYLALGAYTALTPAHRAR